MAVGGAQIMRIVGTSDQSLPIRTLVEEPPRSLTLLAVIYIT